MSFRNYGSISGASVELVDSMLIRLPTKRTRSVFARSTSVRRLCLRGPSFFVVFFYPKMAKERTSYNVRPYEAHETDTYSCHDQFACPPRKREYKPLTVRFGQLLQLPSFLGQASVRRVRRLSSNLADS